MHTGKKEIKFDKRASKYDDGFEGRLSQKFYNGLLSEVELTHGAYVLDVGCGTGALLRRMADQCPIKGCGIDTEGNMIMEAQKKCPDMIIQRSNCEETLFEDDFFDVITACMAYHHFADKKAFAKEASRVLKRGGCLYIADVRFLLPVRTIINAIIEHRNIAGRFCTPQEIYDNFRDYGFEPAGHIKKGLVQIVRLRRIGEI